MKRLKVGIACAALCLLTACSSTNNNDTKKAVEDNRLPKEVLLETFEKNDEISSYLRTFKGHFSNVVEAGGELNIYKLEINSEMDFMVMREGTTTYRVNTAPTYFKTTDTTSESIALAAEGDKKRKILNYASSDNAKGDVENEMYALVKDNLDGKYKDYFKMEMKKDGDNTVIQLKDIPGYEKQIDEEERAKDPAYDRLIQYGQKVSKYEFKEYSTTYTINEKGYLTSVRFKLLRDFGDDKIADTDYTFEQSKFGENLFDVKKMDELFQSLADGKNKKGNSIERLD